MHVLEKTIENSKRLGQQARRKVNTALPILQFCAQNHSVTSWAITDGKHFQIKCLLIIKSSKLLQGALNIHYFRTKN